LVTSFRATYFDGKNAVAHPVTVSYSAGAITVHGEGIFDKFPATRCTVEPALGSTSRTLHLPGDGRIDTDEHSAFDLLEKALGGSRGLRMVYLLENRWKAALAAALIAIFFVAAVSVWGIPFMAKVAADAMPEAAVKAMGEEVL
jgi:hypothetical protein